MQLKHVVLPAPLGPMSPTISNSSTFRLTSSSACRPPKRIESSSASRTGIDALRPLSAGPVHLEARPLQPSSDGRRHRAQTLGLEDQGEDGEQAGEGGNDIDGVVLEEADRLAPVGQVLAAEDVQQSEDDDAAAAAQPADDGDDEVGQGDVGEREV